jgi:hypothetical protein
MTSLPNDSVLVRTWFSNDLAWQQLKAAVATPTADGFLGRIVEDREYEGIDGEALRDATPGDHALVSFIADEQTLTAEGWPILVVWVLGGDSDEGRGLEPFRVIASELSSVENNLNEGNMDWDEIRNAADADGVFRGFR